MSSPLIAGLSIIFASLTWSTAGITVKLLLPSFDPIFIACIRFVFAALCIFPLLIIMKQYRAWKMTFFRTIPFGLLTSINVAFFYFGLTRTTAIAAALVYASVPLLVAFFSWILLARRLSRLKIFGLIVGFIGVAIILLLPVIERGQQITGDIIGNFFILGGALAWTFYTINSEKMLAEKRSSPLLITSGSIITSAIIFFGLTLFFSPTPPLAQVFKLNNLLLFINLAVIVTVGSFFLYHWSIKHSSAIMASLTNYLQPVFTVVLANLILREQITFGFIVGSTLVFCGLLITTGTRIITGVQKLIKR